MFNSKKQFQQIALVAILFFVWNISYAQKADSLSKKWEVTIGLGADISQLLLINPKVGAGENRLGLGWVIHPNANYKKGRLAWDNSGIWSFTIQRLGGGFLNSSDERKPFQKSIDEIRLDSKMGYKFKNESKFYYAANFSFLSQALPTYKGNYLQDIEDPDNIDAPIAQFFSPAQITFSIGIDYKPSEQISLFLSPVSYKSIMVLDDDIANDVVRNTNGEITGSVHGNPVSLDESKMNLISYRHALHNLGSLFKASYLKKFFDDNVSLKSTLTMYANYLENFRQIDYEWTNELNFNVVKGLNISLYTTVFYDYDIYSFKTNSSLPDGVDPTPRRDLISFTEQFVIKYNISF